MFFVNFHRQCVQCSIITNDIVIHWICHCPANETLRDAVLDSFVASNGYRTYIDTITLLCDITHHTQHSLGSHNPH